MKLMAMGQVLTGKQGGVICPMDLLLPLLELTACLKVLYSSYSTAILPQVQQVVSEFLNGQKACTICL